MFEPARTSFLTTILLAGACLSVALSNSGCTFRVVGEPGDQAVHADGSAIEEESAEHSDQRLPAGAQLADRDVGREKPTTTYCRAVSNWDSGWEALEWKALDLVNELRAGGADCGRAGFFEPAQPLAMNLSLRCGARRHAMEMGSRGHFDHFTAEGVGPSDRLIDAGYDGSRWGENIAWGYATPELAVAGWMSSAEHCATLMDSRFTEIGIGYYPLNLWTQLFGRD